MTVRVSQALARVKLIISTDASNKRLITVQTTGSVPVFDSQRNRQALDRAIESQIPLSFPDCEDIVFEETFDGLSTQEATKKGLASFAKLASERHRSVMEAIENKVALEDKAYMEARTMALQLEHQHKRFIYFGKIVTPKVPDIS